MAGNKDIAGLTDLPVKDILADVIESLRTQNRLVVQAPPGAGKTTVLPLALLQSGLAANGRILILEPRRLATRAAAHRMSDLLGEEIGQTVGYRVRLESRISRDSRIEVVTEGILTRYLQDDPSLEGISMILFDEFHERSLDADLGLALALDCQEGLREDLKIIVMSATLDGARVATLMDDAPVITSEGRSYPVEMRYLDRDPKERIEPLMAAKIREIVDQEKGSILAFLPGAGEIRRMAEMLARDLKDENILVCPLFGMMSTGDQDRAIEPAPPGKRKIVLATSIAETSLTIEGIRIVVDSGLMRLPKYDVSTGMSGLETLRVSRAAADQRAGRAGRLEAGICYRLWSEASHRSLIPFSPPEILQADLAPLLLQLACWGVSDPAALRWLDPPQQAPLAEARELLFQLGALDRQGRVTAHGRDMAAPGMHPRLAHMVLRARQKGLGATAVLLAALFAERDILRTREADLGLRLGIMEQLSSGDKAGARRSGADWPAVQRIARQSKAWQREFGLGKNDPVRRDRAGSCIALAYPDRLAANRQRSSPARQRKGQFLLANGRGAVLSPEDPLSMEDYLAVASLDRGDRDARIFLAAPLDLAEIEELFADRITEEETVSWDEATGAVQARRQRKLENIVLSEQRVRDADPDLVLAALIEYVRQSGTDVLPWNKKSRHLCQRVNFIRRHRPEADLPDLTEEGLLDHLEVWLAPYLQGMRKRDDLKKLEMGEILSFYLGWAGQQLVNQLAPATLSVPGGSNIAPDYEQDPPVLAVRLQEMFGVTQTPAVLDGQVKLVVHLLSPAGRPLQVTQDLEGFWKTSYEEVRKDMRGRYLKHHWPDDPLTAVPTRRAKPRKES
ncbi:ATP-dependent helicase HrpB [Emcibacter sp.]|uniref:ATP-dependent helicase HrpB n=1 Tax=Emcibacter sp. TaxID=1979954 RepID=UPI002AA75CF5|nr:ATP-dependent helicase HrpB [Emcibacter sp.]